MRPTVFYVEKIALPALYNHIFEHLPRMPYWYEWQGCQLVYLPLHQLENSDWSSVQDYLTYQFPVLMRPEFGEVLSSLQEPAFLVVNRLLEMLNSDEAQAFLLYTDAGQPQNSPYTILSKYHPEADEVSSFFLSGFLQLWRTQNPLQLEDNDCAEMDAPIVSQSRMIVPALKDEYSKPISHAYFSLDTQGKLSFDSAEVGIEDIAILSGEVRARLKQLSEVKNRTAILDLVVYLLNNLNPNLRVDQVSVFRMLEQHWNTHVNEEQPSRLRIDEHYRIYLTDYGNREITMGRLPKLLFLFYLRHPEGVNFRDLRRHRAELKEIYSKITNRSDPAVIERSIDRLIDVHQNNSINEKCSRIREAFEKEISLTVAAHYLIQGPRGGLKRISLDRHLCDLQY